MKTELIFFDSFENSKKGTVRGLVAFISLIIIDLIWFSISKNNIYNNVSLKHSITRTLINSSLVYLVLCSAIGVQLPKSYNEALVYGMLVGFVTYSVFNLTSNTIFDWDINTAIIDTIAGTINCGIASSMVYLICHK